MSSNRNKSELREVQLRLPPAPHFIHGQVMSCLTRRQAGFGHRLASHLPNQLVVSENGMSSNRNKSELREVQLRIPPAPHFIHGQAISCLTRRQAGLGHRLANHLPNHLVVYENGHVIESE